MLDVDRAAEPDDLVGLVAALAAGSARVGVPLALQALAAGAANLGGGNLAASDLGFRIRSAYIWIRNRLEKPD
jgi:hypothetical protein